jgi:hypothetical protein
MITTVINRIVNTAIPAHENFGTLNDSMDKLRQRKSGVELLVAVVTMVVVILLLSFIGLYLWNAVIAGADKGTGLITAAKPASSIWQILGMYILLALLVGR